MCDPNQSINNEHTAAYPRVQEVAQQLEEPSQYMSIHVIVGLH